MYHITPIMIKRQWVSVGQYQSIFRKEWRDVGILNAHREEKAKRYN